MFFVVSVKHGLQKHLAELGSYKDRVQKLQNQLIKVSIVFEWYLRATYTTYVQITYHMAVFLII